MRRGLMGWNPDELPLGILAERRARLQAAMQKDGLQALMIYTNLVRPSAVSYLTGLTPYWSEGLLLFGRHGEPAFATALSKRVANWIRSVSPVGEIVNTPRPGAVLGARIAAAGMTRVGILEFDAFPSGAYDDLVAAAPGAEFVDATRLFAEARRGADSAEQRLLARADAIAVAALGEVDPNGAPDAGSVAGLVEKHARLNGAEEAYIAVAPDLASDPRMIRASPALPLGQSFAVRASIAYKGFWVRRTRTFATGAGREALAHADQWFAQCVHAIQPEQSLAEQIKAQAKSLNGATLESWMAESCIGSYPLQVVASSRAATKDVLQHGDFLVLTIALSLDGMPWLGAAPTIVADRRS